MTALRQARMLRYLSMVLLLVLLPVPSLLSWKQHSQPRWKTNSYMSLISKSPIRLSNHRNAHESKWRLHAADPPSLSQGLAPSLLSTDAVRKWWSSRGIHLLTSRKFLLSLLLPMMLVAVSCGLHSLPVSAAVAMSSSELKAMLEARLKKRGTGAIRVPSLIDKLFLGANVKSNFRSLKAGDTRAEIAMIINGVTMLMILFVWGSIAYLFQKREETMELSNMRKEVLREKQYRENMYFDAVEQILSKLADPKIKGSLKADLSRQLRDLDPDGAIRRFLEEGGERPNLSSAIQDINKNSASKAPSGGEKSLQKKKRPTVEGKPTNKATAPPVVIRAATADDDAADGGDSNFIMLFKELEESLEGVLSAAKREQLLSYLKRRVAGISDPAKKEVALSKIAEKLGSDKYWQDYAAGLE